MPGSDAQSRTRVPRPHLVRSGPHPRGETETHRSQDRVHPEGREEVVQDADAVGSTDFICRYVEKAAPGTSNYSETEINPVRRLAKGGSRTRESLNSRWPALTCPGCNPSVDGGHSCSTLREKPPFTEGILQDRSVEPALDPGRNRREEPGSIWMPKRNPKQEWRSKEC